MARCGQVLENPVDEHVDLVIGQEGLDTPIGVLTRF